MTENPKYLRMNITNYEHTPKRPTVRPYFRPKRSLPKGKRRTCSAVETKQSLIGLIFVEK